MQVSVGDVRLFVEMVGPARSGWTAAAERPILIGLHGGPGVDGTTLRHFLAPLSYAARVVVPDQRGHGRSDHGTPADWNLQTWAADVGRLCAALDLTRPVVLGVSFGGFVAQQYASTYPNDLAGLILVSTAPRYPADDDVIARARDLAGDQAAEALRRSIEEPAHDRSAADRERLRPLYRRRRDLEMERVEPHIVRNPEVVEAWVPQARCTMDLRSDLRAVRCPTLVLAGELDPFNPPALATEIVRSIPGDRARLEVIPGAAHHVFVDNPERTYRSIREFIASLD